MKRMFVSWEQSLTGASQLMKVVGWNGVEWMMEKKTRRWGGEHQARSGKSLAKVSPELCPSQLKLARPPVH